MRYWYDWEFFENGHTITPISVGIVAEDGRELYMINLSFYNQRGWRGAVSYQTSPWIEENVMAYITKEDVEKHGIAHSFMHKEILNFISDSGKIKSRKDVELWGYYAAYDHVCLAQLWGPMINLPEPIPMFTHEIMNLAPSDGVKPLRRTAEHHALNDAKYQKEIWELWSGHAFGKDQNA